MLTKDLLKAQAALIGLTDEQITAIETLSKNDEDAVIGKRIGEVYREFDAKVDTLLGVKRDGDEKTYLYFERAAKLVKAKADEAEKAKTDIEAITKEKSRLEKIISDNEGDKETANKLKQAQADLKATKELYTTLQGEFEGLKGKHSEEIAAFKKDSVLSAAMSGIKLKSEYPKALLDTAINNAITKVKGMPSEFVKNADGSETLVFRGPNGETLTNKENSLNPFTAADLVKAELKGMGVLDEGRKQNGAGTNPGGKGNDGASMDISGAKNRVEAGKLIETGLMQQGLTKGSAEFQTALDKAWIDNNVSALPME